VEYDHEDQVPSSFGVACQYDQYAVFGSGLDGLPLTFSRKPLSSVALKPALFSAAVPLP